MSISLPVKKKTPAYQQKKKDFTIIYIAEIFPFLCDVTTGLKFRKARTKKGYACHPQDAISSRGKTFAGDR
jgi:hypothetical protein